MPSDDMPSDDMNRQASTPSPPSPGSWLTAGLSWPVASAGLGLVSLPVAWVCGGGAGDFGANVALLLFLVATVPFYARRSIRFSAVAIVLTGGVGLAITTLVRALDAHSIVPAVLGMLLAVVVAGRPTARGRAVADAIARERTGRERFWGLMATPTQQDEQVRWMIDFALVVGVGISGLALWRWLF